MNKYELRIESQDGITWQVTVKADGFSEQGDVIVFWCGRWFRRNVHMIAKQSLICVIGDRGNK
jgi:hypothetical protein